MIFVLEAKDYFLCYVKDKHKSCPGMLSGSVLDSALFVVTSLITASGGERTLDLGSEDLVSGTFSSTNDMSRLEKNSLSF